MGLDLRLQQRLAQSLVMTPQLQQAIKLLQLSHLEMAAALRDEMAENPILEDQADGPGGDGDGEGDDGAPPEGHDGDGDGDQTAADGEATADGEAAGDGEAAFDDRGGEAAPEPAAELAGDGAWEAYLDGGGPAAGGGGTGDELPPLEASLTRPESLHDHLRWQVQMAPLTPPQAALCMLLVESVGDDGYLATGAVAEAAQAAEVDLEEAEAALAALQELEPVGVAARDLRECLLLQLRRRGPADPLVEAIVAQHLSLVERRAFAAIARACAVDVAAVGAAVRAIARLEPRPGRAFVSREPQYITPDIYVHRVGDGYEVVLNDDGLPRLQISRYYREAMQHTGGATRSYMQDKMRQAAWLIRSVHMRQRTITRVMQSILRFQGPFFERGVQHLRPLILREVAEDVGMHESTISRVTTNKYVHTPRGIYELKFFFNSSIQQVDGDSVASESVRSHIERLVGEENPRAPYSDQRIVEILRGRKIDVARRTVAKYRDMLKIPSSSRRRRVF